VVQKVADSAPTDSGRTVVAID